MSYDEPARDPAPGDPTPAFPATYPYPPPYSAHPYPPPYQHLYPPPFYYPPLPPRPPTNGLAVASMVVSFIAIFTCLVFVSPVALVMGYIARRQIVEQEQSGREFATVGIVCGWIGTALLLLIGAFFLFPFVILLVASL